MISDLFRWTPQQFLKAARAGWFDNIKAELLGGIVFKLTTNPPHANAVYRLANALKRIVPEPEWLVSKQDTIRLGSWFPLPDATILRGPLEKHGRRLPSASDVFLIAEVSDSTYKKDRGPKYRRYASFRIPTYWIVDLDRRRVEVHSQPAVGSVYGSVDYYPESDAVPVVLDGRHLGDILVKDILA